MKTADYWQSTLCGETSVESIAHIQADALTEAMRIINDHGVHRGIERIADLCDSLLVRGQRCAKETA
jgi:hypothetical protein